MELNVRFLLRHDSYENWTNINPYLEIGEIAIAYLSKIEDPSMETVLIKTGPGNYNDLPYVSALAADVFSWAKKTEIEFVEWLDSLFSGSTLNSLNKIREEKVDRNELDNYLKIEDYIKGETGGTINISNFLTKSQADSYYAPINVLETVYPVGAIYLSMIDTNPSTLFNFGVWEKIENRFLLAASTSYPVGSMGGEAEHTLTESEMPAHSHNFNRHQLWRNETGAPADVENGYGASNKTLDIYVDSTTTVGSSNPHNNMPPYLAVYMWQRVS